MSKQTKPGLIRPPAKARKIRPVSQLSFNQKYRKPLGALGWGCFLLVAFFVAVGFNLALPERTPDFDTFYHLRHAEIYLHQGLFNSAFPWANFSVIHRAGADLWYGFHLLLMPLAGLSNAIDQLKGAGSLVLVAFLALFYGALRRSKLQLSFLWPLITLFSSVLVVGRLMMARPHVISMGLLALLFSLLVEGGLWGIFAVCAALSFIHLSFFWTALLVAGVTALVKWRITGLIEWRKLTAVPAGLLVGWLLRPNPIGAAKLLYVQLVDLYLAKQHGMEGFGVELNPLHDLRYLYFSAFFIIFWLGLVAVSLIKVRRAALSPQARTLLWGSLALALPCGAGTFLLSGRLIDLWLPFAVISLAVCASYLLNPWRIEPQLFSKRTRLIVAGVGVVLALGMGLSCWKSYLSYIEQKQGIPIFRLAGAANWLKEHAPPKAIVFHAHWDNFAELFYWNPNNYYIGGMDPVFQYAYSPELYWKARHLATNETGSHTWGTPGADRSQQEDTYTVLRRDFHASYVVVQRNYTPTFYSYLANDSRFIASGYDDGMTAVFRLADAPVGMPRPQGE